MTKRSDKDMNFKSRCRHLFVTV